jgi:GNAT superfamily N-acetyltransferase
MNRPSFREEAAVLDVAVRPLLESDLPVADHVMRLAFGTFVGLPEPTSFMGDADFVHTRWRANPDAAFAVLVGGRFGGSNFATRWGSVGFFGPLTTHPDLWDRGVGKRLMEPIMDCFDRWGTQHAGLFTFSHSTKHVALYQSFGFWPRFLTAIMSKPVTAISTEFSWTAFSDVPLAEREDMLTACNELTDAVYEGLDVSEEIRAVAAQKLGDTLLLWDDGALVGLAVCHCGAGSEAGGGTCYIKFGVVRSGPSAARDFNTLLGACETMAARKGLTRLVAGCNLARAEAYGCMKNNGFRADLQGVAMQRHNDAGYNRPGIYLIDDWR